MAVAVVELGFLTSKPGCSLSSIDKTWKKRQIPVSTFVDGKDTPDRSNDMVVRVGRESGAMTDQ